MRALPPSCQAPAKSVSDRVCEGSEEYGEKTLFPDSRESSYEGPDAVSVSRHKTKGTVLTEAQNPPASAEDCVVAPMGMTALMP